jgi:hypothetical protein
VTLRQPRRFSRTQLGSLAAPAVAGESSDGSLGWLQLGTRWIDRRRPREPPRLKATAPRAASRDRSFILVRDGLVGADGDEAAGNGAQSRMAHWRLLSTR